MIATRSSRFEKASSQQVVGLCSTIARTERQLSNCGAQPPASKAIDFLVQDTRPLLPLVFAHRRQRPNPMANVVIETTNCNSCHPGHCGRSEVRSYGMGVGRFNCRGAACTLCTTGIFSLSEGGDGMTQISMNSGVITLINVFTVEPANQRRLVELLTSRHRRSSPLRRSCSCRHR